MSRTPEAATNGSEDADADADADAEGERADREDLLARLDLLQEENRRLRRDYARARRSSYRRTALALGAIGVAAAGAGVAFPGSRQVLLALGAVGLFGAVLTYYLTPEQFVSAAVGERVYRALATNEADIVADLGLSHERVYVPTGGVESDASADARLFVPQHESYTVPDATALEEPFVVTEDGRTQGVSLQPTGDPLFSELERALAGPLADEPGPLAQQLADGVVEQFELASALDVDREDDRISVGVTDSLYGSVERFDHPVVSVFAVGLARGLDQPVAAETSVGDDRFEYVITLRLPDDDGA
ncbi:hypothetical protein [Halorarius halobius]|uniref:hypothetical protein n=1 Tax=Halorarius halobius TaxID=2962671 RepID=UPI0020CE95D0|nr:hypothetical protein [Halorarius halobius]